MTGKGARILSGAGLAAGLLAASYPLWRDWCLNWGATPDEVASPLSGDELLPDADLVTTRAIAIEAAPRPDLAVAGADGQRPRGYLHLRLA